MWCKYRETCISSNKFRRPAIKFSPHWLELLSLCSYNFSFLIPCTVFNHFILNSHKNLVFSCDFASLPDASHGDQSSRNSRCWVSGFPCRSDSFVIKLHPFSILFKIIMSKFHCLVVILQDYGYRLHSATRKHRDEVLGTWILHTCENIL